MVGKAASESLVSCMHSTSGSAYSSHSSTRGRRAFSEFTFQVAMRTCTCLVGAHHRLHQLLAELGILGHERLVDDLLFAEQVDVGSQGVGGALQVQHLLG